MASTCRTAPLLRSIAFLLCALLLLAALGHADELLMKDGRRVEGTITREDNTQVVIETRLGRQTFLKKDVKEITRGKTSKDVFDERFQAAASSGEFLELGRWADERKLRSEARKAMKRVVELDTDNAEAREYLGYRRYKDEWLKRKEYEKRIAKDEAAAQRAKGLVEYDGRWVTPEEKEALEKGFVLHEGRWMAFEEAQRMKGLEAWRDEWLSFGEARPRVLAQDVLQRTGVGKFEVEAGLHAVVAGPFSSRFLTGISGGLDEGRTWFDSLFPAPPGVELTGGRQGMFLVYGRDSDPYKQSTDELVALTRTLQSAHADHLKRTHGFFYNDPWPVSSARVWGRPEAHLEGHCYHHWGHLLLNSLGYDGRLLPPWYDEGFASLLEWRTHERFDVFCIAHEKPITIGGATSSKRIEFKFETKDFRRGDWRRDFKKAVAAGAIASFDKLAQKSVGELTLWDIATSMAVCEWLIEQGEGRPAAEQPIWRFHEVIRRKMPGAPLRSPIKGAERQAMYDAAFGAAVEMGWRQVDAAWREWVETSW